MAAADYRLMTEATGQRIAAALESLVNLGDPVTIAHGGTGATTAAAALAALGGLSPSDVVNNLTSTSTTAPLSAAQGKALQDGKVAKTGDTMTGTLNLTPSGSEGGEIHLNASTDRPAHSGIAIDQQGPGVLRVFGLASADGTTRTGSGTALFIDPYLKTITGGYTFTGNVTGTASGNLTSADVVNNLTSGGATVPLSAEQGKELGKLIKSIYIPANRSYVLSSSGQHHIYIVMGYVGNEGCRMLYVYHFGVQSYITVKNLLDNTDYSGNLTFTWNANDSTITITSTASQGTTLTVVTGY